MQLAMIGLGRMGGNMSERLMRDGHKMVVFDRSPEAVQKYVASVRQARRRRPKWFRSSAHRVSCGSWFLRESRLTTRSRRSCPECTKGDVIIDGGNSNFHDTMRRAAELKRKGIHFVDSGTSGGIWGLENGYCLMIGASDEAFALCEPIFKHSRRPMDTRTWVRRVGPLREDDSQRRRVRNASGVCRRL